MSILRKRSVAIVLTIVMVIAAIGIGQAKHHRSENKKETEISQEFPPSSGELVYDSSSYYVYDDAGVLSSETIEALSEQNAQLLGDLDVVIAVVTCNYGRSDLDSYALEYADRIGLAGSDFIIVLDISGDNYWLVQGSNLISQFTDEDCSDYAWKYMETYFAKGDYDSAVLSLQDALSSWYYSYF